MKTRPTMRQEERGRNICPEPSYSSSSSSLSSIDVQRKTKYSTGPKSKNPRDSAIALRSKEEPSYHPSPNDVPKTIQVYSHSDEGLIEVKAVFVDNLDENWISKSLVDRLNPGFLVEEQGGYGHLTLKTVKFLGRITIQWAERGSLKTLETDCHVVKSECFDLYLRKCLLPPSSPHQRTSRTPSDTHKTPFQTTQEDLSTIQSDSAAVVGSFDGLASERIDDEANKSADKWMTELKATIHTYIDSESKYPRRKPPVKIAVLDTGIDSSHPFIKGALSTKRIPVAESFINNNKGVEDSFGHGTHVASLILEVAPDAELYIAKVAEEGTIPYDHNIAKAIRWAISQNVDIITMSFGLENHQKEIEDAVKEAYAKGIILFAAASNDGGNSPVSYPAKYDDVICVFSTDGLGNASKCNPTPMENSPYHYATLGEAVNSAWPTHLPDSQGNRRMTGTSFATPIAAAVAACILEFALMNSMSDEQYHELKCPKGMRAVFSKRMVEKRQDFHYICPWKLFKNRDDDLILTLITEVLDS